MVMIDVTYIVYFLIGMLAGILLEFALTIAVGWKIN